MAAAADPAPASSRSPRRHRPGPGAAFGLVAAAVLVGSGTSWFGLATPEGTDVVRPALSPVSLTTYDRCPALLAGLRERARRVVGPYGLSERPVQWLGAYGVDTATAMRQDAWAGGRAEAGASDDAAPSGAPQADGAPAVQVEGVAEADTMAVDGDLLVTAAEDRILLSRLRGGHAERLGRVLLAGWRATSVLLDGDDLIVIGAGPGGRVDPAGGGGTTAGAAAGSAGGGVAERVLPSPGWGGGGNGTRIAHVDVSDPDKPRITRTMDMDGSVTGARLVGGSVRVVLGSTPTAPWVAPQWDNTASREAAERTNRQLLEETTLADWLPSYRIGDGDRAGGAPRPLLACDQVALPEHPRRFDVLSLVQFPIRGNGLDDVEAAATVADGATVYASSDRVYVASWSEEDRPRPLDESSLVAPERDPRGSTAVHAFGLSGNRPSYLGSGEVEGRLLNQFALDEDGGVLRVASTTGSGEGSSNRVTTMRLDGGRLRAIGSLTGLGPTEQIRGVRFAGPVGYVVTFRQTDPLYTLDLSDPEHPRRASTLKMPGFSAYLQPLPGGRLLGVGQAGTDEGRLTGTAVSLFDVRDPAATRRLDTVEVPGAWSEATDTHRAVTVAGDLVLVPYQRWSEEGTFGTIPGEPGSQTFDAGVVAVPVTGSGLGRAHLLRPLGDGPIVVRPDVKEGGDAVDKNELEDRTSAVVQRTVVRDGYLYSVTPRGIAGHDLRTWSRVSFTRY